MVLPCRSGERTEPAQLYRDVRPLDRPVGAVISSSSARSSAVGSHRPASAFARTCSGVVAPAITEATAGCAASPPMATRAWSARAPRRTPRAVRGRPTARRPGSRPTGPATSRVPAAGGSSRLYLPVSSPLASGKNGSRPTPNRSQAGITSASTLAVEQRVLVLRADERRSSRAVAGRPGGVGDLPAGEVRRADVAHLARPDQVVQRRQRLLDRGLRRRAGAAGTGRCSRCPAGAATPRPPADVAAAAAGTPVRPVGAVHGHAELGGDDDVVARAASAPRRGAPPSRRAGRRRRRRCRRA